MMSSTLRKLIYCNRENITVCNRIWIAIHKRHYFEGKFEDNAHCEILKFLNESDSASDFSNFSISKANSNKLIKFKNQNGLFTSLDDPLPALGPQPLEKFYRSILKGETSPSTRVSSAMHRMSSSETQDEICKVMSVCLVGNRVSWSLVNKAQNSQESISHPDFELDDLCSQEINYKAKTHFLTVFQMIQDIVREIPQSDVYVFEDAVVNVPTAYLFNYALQKSQIRAFTMGLLASRENSQIVSIKSVAIARMFKLHVGAEKVSGQTIAETVINNQAGFKVREDLTWNYQSANAEDREHLANALLLNLAYWTLTNQYKYTNLSKTLIGAQ